VKLFFLISGFVIFMTLDRTTSMKIFICKRWLRLFPAMVVVSVLIFLTSSIFFERPLGIPEPISLLPGLMFLDPSWLKHIIGYNIQPLEVAFWSIYVEFKFYVIAAIVYYGLGRKYLVPSLVFAYTLHLLVELLSLVSIDILILTKIVVGMSLSHFGWFAAGAFFYWDCEKKNSNVFGILGMAVTLIACVDLAKDFRELVFSIGVVSIFIFSFKVELLRRFLENRVFIFYGIISYPLYLIHENMMISMIIKYSSFFPYVPSIVYPFIALVFVSALSFCVVGVESKIRNGIGLIKNPTV